MQILASHGVQNMRRVCASTWVVWSRRGAPSRGRPMLHSNRRTLKTSLGLAPPRSPGKWTWKWPSWCRYIFLLLFILLLLPPIQVMISGIDELTWRQGRIANKIIHRGEGERCYWSETEVRGRAATGSVRGFEEPSRSTDGHWSITCARNTKQGNSITMNIVACK